MANFAILLAMTERLTTTNTPRAAWLVLGVGVIAYVLTVMQRTTLGVVGLDAADRFQISPGALAMFVFIQVAVYVSAQIPAGLMVDRFGSRAMLVVSGALLVCGQLLWRSPRRSPSRCRPGCWSAPVTPSSSLPCSR
jgi:nitrate/nitrite transporter NarK